MHPDLAALCEEAAEFFVRRGYRRVRTPLVQPLPPSSTDIAPHPAPHSEEAGWLRPSPEYHLKGLLARGQGPLFEIGPCFRPGEAGRHHAPSFTMLEWYRLDEDLDALHGEAQELLRHLLGPQAASLHRCSYREAFARHCGFDPLARPEDALAAAAEAGLRTQEVPTALDYLLTHRVAPALARLGLWSLHDWPVQLADLDDEAERGGRRWCRRFEVFCGEIELLNACVELRRPELLQRRPRVRAQARTPQLARLLRALPPCSGAALGMDRVLMLRLGLDRLPPAPLQE